MARRLVTSWVALRLQGKIEECESKSVGGVQKIRAARRCEQWGWRCESAPLVPHTPAAPAAASPGWARADVEVAQLLLRWLESLATCTMKTRLAKTVVKLGLPRVQPALAALKVWHMAASGTLLRQRNAAAQLQTAQRAWRSVSIGGSSLQHRRTRRHGTLQTVPAPSAPPEVWPSGSRK